MTVFEFGGPPPPEVVRYWRTKQLRPAFSWQDVWGQEHAFAFTVAKATQLDVLTAFQGAIGRAIDGGLPFEAFKADIEGELRRIGWAGPRVVTDPVTGQKATTNLTAPRRLRTIFHANVRSARAAGQWERAQRSKRMLPYFLYIETTARDPRPEHREWVGTILPVDHPFWETHFPPNDWGCQCAVRQITEAEARRRGGPTQAPLVRLMPYRNKRTGEVTDVPEGVGPGWHTNPGLARARTLTDSLRDRLDEAGAEDARRTIAELLATDAPRLLMQVPQRLQLPVGLSDRAAATLRARSPIVVVSNDTMRVKTGKHAPVDAKRFAAIQQMLDSGQLVDEGRGDDQRTLIATLGRGRWKLVLKRSAAGWLRVQTLYRIDERRFRKLAGE